MTSHTQPRLIGVAVGALGLVSIALVGLSESTAGIFERGSVYSWLLWSVVTGALILTRYALRHAAVAERAEHVAA
ncbi:hypothetical protein [Streptomyces sp. NPDC050848]|uniref:hypothetical protein n=1 Tax=Streptomyces sp. NPDC050848 TaxID=3155791 RepID=UPI0033CBB164